MERSFQFDRTARVTRAEDYGSAFKHGVRVHGRFFMCVHNASAKPAAKVRNRLGLAVSRKVDRRAVGRNRIKRHVREWFRHRRGELPAGDWILVARPAAREAAGSELKAELDRLVTSPRLK